jgi:hypothetical protein
MRPLLVEMVTESKILGIRPGFPDRTLFLVLFSDRMPSASMIDGAVLQGKNEHLALPVCLKHMHLDCSFAMHHKLPNSAVFFRSPTFYPVFPYFYIGFSCYFTFLLRLLFALFLLWLSHHSNLIPFYFHLSTRILHARGSMLFKALCYKLEVAGSIPN